MLLSPPPDETRPRREDEVAAEPFPDEMKIVARAPHVLTRARDQIGLQARVVGRGARSFTDVGVRGEDADWTLSAEDGGTQHKREQRGRNAHGLWSPSNREVVLPRADLHNDVLAALACGAYAARPGEGAIPFPHLVDTSVPQGDFRRRVRRDGDIEHESPPLPVDLPRPRERPVERLEGRARTREARPWSRGDA